MPLPPSSAPLSTVTTEAPTSPVTSSVPVLTSVAPENVLLSPESSKVPLPVLMRPPEPDRPPENTVDLSLPPVVNVADPVVTEPAPASEPISWLKLFSASVAPVSTV